MIDGETRNESGCEAGSEKSFTFTPGNCERERTKEEADEYSGRVCVCARARVCSIHRERQ